ncbi:MAG: hypothetical protein IJX67_06565 [Oscillospiraceae bacterium]|nr:hypothetical protein [Oscillospiraceae bacterium]
MKNEKLLSCLWSAAVAFLLAFGAVGALDTGFGMDSGFGVPIFVGLAALFFAVCFVFFGGAALALGALALGCGFVWRTGDLVIQTQALLYRISSCYNGAYGWGTLTWNHMDLAEVLVTVPLILIGALIALTVTWVMCRQRREWLAVVVSLLPLLACVVVTDTVPGEEMLFLFFLGLILLIMTQTVRRGNIAAGNRLTEILVIPVSLALALLFWLVPQDQYVPPDATMSDQLTQWYEFFREVDVQESVSEWITNTFNTDSAATAVNLKTTGRRAEYQNRVMEVTAAETGPLYLRGMAYDTYDGYSWTVSQGNWAEPYSFYPLYGDLKGGTVVGEVKITTRSIHDVIYFPYAPGIPMLGQQKNGSYLNRERLNSYTIQQIKAENIITSDLDTCISGAEQEAMRQYLQLPEATREQAESYLRQHTDLSLNNSGQQIQYTAAVIRQTVSGSADYDLNTGRMPGGESDFAMWFLEESETGYCVHFATAATVLLRAAGIPARYVTGYLVDGVEGVPVTVRGKDSHAWVEYWCPGLGWLRLEPTPGNSTGEVAETQPEETQSPESAAQRQETDTTQSGAQQESTEPVSEYLENKNEEPTGPESSGIWPILGMAATITIAMLILLIAQWKIRVYLKKKRLNRGNTNQRALYKWQEAELMAKILHTLPPKELEELAVKARFSQHELTETELIRFDDELARCKCNLRQQFIFRAIFVRLLYAID